MLWVKFEGMDVVVFGWWGCRNGVYRGCVCFRGSFLCIGEFDVVVCEGGLDGVGIYVCVNCFLYDVL